MAAIPFPVLSWWSRTYNCVSDFVIRYRFEKSCLAMCYHNCIERLFLINDLDIVAAKKNYVTLFSLTKNRSFDSKSKHLKCRCFKLSQISIFHSAWYLSFVTLIVRNTWQSGFYLLWIVGLKISYVVIVLPLPCLQYCYTKVLRSS